MCVCARSSYDSGRVGRGGCGACATSRGAKASRRIAARFPSFSRRRITTAGRASALQRGYLCCVYAGSDSRDDTDTFVKAYPEYDWSRLTRRAWAAGRCIDYLETVPEADTTARCSDRSLAQRKALANRFRHRRARRRRDFQQFGGRGLPADPVLLRTALWRGDREHHPLLPRLVPSALAFLRGTRRTGCRSISTNLWR